MLRHIALMTGFDLNFMIRNRESMMWMFLMPVIFMFLIGSITRERSGGEGKTEIAVLREDQGPVSTALLGHLEDLDFAVVPVDSESALAGHDRQLRIPAGFSEKVISAVKQKIAYAYHGEPSPAENLAEVRVRRAVFLTLGDVVLLAANDSTSLAAGGSAPDAASGSASVAAGDSTSPAAGNLAFTDADFRRIAAMPPAIAIDVSSAGERRKVPSGFDQAVPGIMVMFVLLVLLTTGGVLLVTERQEGLLRRLASSQVSKGEIVLSKLLARICLGMVQAGFAMLVGTLLFRIDWGGEVPGILLLLLAYGVSTSALSILFGNLARTRGQAVGFGVLGAILMAALGGCWWPIEVVPSFLQKIAWGLPTGWTMYALHRMMSFGEGFSAAVPALLLLASSAVVFFILAARTFRYQ